MKLKLNLLHILLLSFLFYTCSSGLENESDNFSEDNQSYDLKDSTGFVSSSAAGVNKDTTRKFVRTATMRFRVKNVLKSSLFIEDVVSEFDGFVNYTNLDSRVENTELTVVSVDSTLETIYYSVTNKIQIRVPTIYLDSALRKIATHIEFLDYRTIKAEDITLSLLANKLNKNRITKHNKRISKELDSKDGKLKETINAEENLLNKEEKIDESILSTLKMEDQVNFSTVNLDIYQRDAVKRSLIENYKNIEEYKPGFLSLAWESIVKGWLLMERLITFLLSIWPFILISIIIWFLYNRYLKK